MKTYDTSTWVMRHYLHSVPIKNAFTNLLNHDRTKSIEEWLNYLLNQGMVSISDDSKKEWIKWRQKIEKKQLDCFLLKLQKEFNGPDIDVFFFPLNKKHEKIMTDLGGKNGATFSKFILLFWHEGLSIKHQKALLLHEYHHAARLEHQHENERSITLLESLVMEGLSEWEVRQRLGEEYLAPWTKLYQKDELVYWWNRLIKNRIGIKGRIHHQAYLFGGEHGIPPWIGYQLGYHLVESYALKHREEGSLDLLKTPGNQFASIISN